MGDCLNFSLELSMLCLMTAQNGTLIEEINRNHKRNINQNNNNDFNETLYEV
jgi:hypothetical protein